MTPLTRRRLANFRANRRGYYSLVIFLALFGISLVSEVIANDKPIIMRHNGELWSPSCSRTPSTTWAVPIE